MTRATRIAAKNTARHSTRCRCGSRMVDGACSNADRSDCSKRGGGGQHWVPARKKRAKP